MEENKKVKISLGTTICIFIIILLVIGLGVMYYFGFVKNKSNDNNNSNANVAATPVTDNTTNENSKKLDESKDYVYDAEYYGKDGNKSYTTPYDEKFALKDINVPYININSEDAKKVNKEIKELYDELAELFEEEYEDAKTWYNIASYEVYTNKNVLSVVITTQSGGTDVEKSIYYAYNFDLNTLKKLSFEEIYQIAGFTKENINSCSEAAILNEIKSRMENFENGINMVSLWTLDEYNNAIKKNELMYFLSDNGKLKIITNIYLPVGRGEFNTILEINQITGSKPYLEFTSADNLAAQGYPTILKVYNIINDELEFNYNYGIDLSKNSLDREISGKAKLIKDNIYEYTESIQGKEYKLKIEIKNQEKDNYSSDDESTQVNAKQYVDGNLDVEINLWGL